MIGISWFDDGSRTFRVVHGGHPDDRGLWAVRDQDGIWEDVEYFAVPQDIRDSVVIAAELARPDWANRWRMDYHPPTASDLAAALSSGGPQRRQAAR